MNVNSRDLMRSKIYIYLFAFCAMAIIGMVPEVAMAQIEEDNLLQGTLNTYRDNMAGIAGNIGNALLNTFVLLATIEFIWGMIKNYIDNGGLQGFLSEVITRIMFISFFYYLYTNGTAFPIAIVNSFKELATTAVPGTPTKLMPDNVVDIGQNFMSASWEVIKGGEILTGLTMLFASVIVLIAMVILAAHMAVAILEFYVVGYGGVVLLAFGASRWTHGYAVSYLKYAMSVGMKLFVLYIIAAVVTVQMAAYFTDVNQSSATNVWGVAAFALFSVILAITAPQSVMGMMSGVSIASGAGAAAAVNTVSNTVKGAASAVGGAAGAATGTVTQTAGMAAAGKAAASLGSAASKASGAGGVGGVASGAAAVAKTAGAAAMKSAFPVAQSVGGKAASRMNAAAKSISDKT